MALRGQHSICVLPLASRTVYRKTNLSNHPCTFIEFTHLILHCVVFLFVCCYKTWKSLLRFLPVYVVYGAERKTLPRQTFGRVRHTMREYTYIIYISFIDVTCRHLVYIWRLSLGYPSDTCPWDTHYQFSIKNSNLYTLSVRLTSTSGWRPQAFRGVWQCVYKYKSFIYM